MLNAEQTGPAIAGRVAHRLRRLRRAEMAHSRHRSLWTTPPCTNPITIYYINHSQVVHFEVAASGAFSSGR